VRKPVYLGGREYHFEQMLGRSYAWEHKRGYVILARGPDGERVAIKQVIPQSYAGATLSIEAEVRLSNALHKFVATHGHPGGVRLPRFIAHDQYNAAAELVQDAVPLQRYLRKPRTLGGGIAKEDNAVCWAVVYKVAILLQSMQHVRFRHRDLHDGNVLIRLKTQPVTSCDDVDVWLVDFGKAMALVNEDGELDSDGNLMSSLDGGSVSTV